MCKEFLASPTIDDAQVLHDEFKRYLSLPDSLGQVGLFLLRGGFTELFAQASALSSLCVCPPACFDFAFSGRGSSCGTWSSTSSPPRHATCRRPASPPATCARSRATRRSTPRSARGSTRSRCSTTRCTTSSRLPCTTRSVSWSSSRSTSCARSGRARTTPSSPASRAPSSRPRGSTRITSRSCRTCSSPCRTARST